jgi:hypothetical protein
VSVDSTVIENKQNDVIVRERHKLD